MTLYVITLCREGKICSKQFSSIGSAKSFASKLLRESKFRDEEVSIALAIEYFGRSSVPALMKGVGGKCGKCIISRPIAIARIERKELDKMAEKKLITTEGGDLK